MNKKEVYERILGRAETIKEDLRTHVVVEAPPLMSSLDKQQEVTLEFLIKKIARLEVLLEGEDEKHGRV